MEEQLRSVPLLEDQFGPRKQKKSPVKKALRKTLKGTTYLANLLPTGSVLAFQILSPVLTQQGNCNSIIDKYMTLALIGFCSVTCCLLCFTDSIRDERGKVRYGVATFSGLWIIDGSAIEVPKEDAIKYKLKFIDFFHGITSVFVFGAIALLDHNVVHCFYPMPSENTQHFLHKLAIAVGVICSLLFVAFPTTRHGIGFPLSQD